MRPKKFPPGPTNIPLLGSLLFVDVRNLSKSFTKLAKKYGDIFSVFVGRTPVVVLNSYDIIKVFDLFSNSKFTEAFRKHLKNKNIPEDREISLEHSSREGK